VNRPAKRSRLAEKVVSKSLVHDHDGRRSGLVTLAEARPSIMRMPTKSKYHGGAELMARIQALLRRTPAQNGQDVHQFGSILVDLQRGEVTRDGRSVHLATREFELLRYLIERTGTPVSREELLAAVWGPTSMSRVVRTHIARLREKLEADPKCPELIVTVEGMGYKFAGSRNW
jgi:DNA-binding response OmpR family regulator